MINTEIIASSKPNLIHEYLEASAKIINDRDGMLHCSCINTAISSRNKNFKKLINNLIWSQLPSCCVLEVDRYFASNYQ